MSLMCQLHSIRTGSRRLTELRYDVLLLLARCEEDPGTDALAGEVLPWQVLVGRRPLLRRHHQVDHEPELLRELISSIRVVQVPPGGGAQWAPLGMSAKTPFFFYAIFTGWLLEFYILATSKVNMRTGTEL